MGEKNETELKLLESQSQAENVSQNNKADLIEADVIDQEPLGGDQNTKRKQPVSKSPKPEVGRKSKMKDIKNAVVKHSTFYMVKRKKKKKKNYENRESNDVAEEFVGECCAIYLAGKTYKILTWPCRHCDCSGDCDCDCCGDCDCDCCGSDCDCVCDSDDDC